jgi:uncharacterized membrane protein
MREGPTKSEGPIQSNVDRIASMEHNALMARSRGEWLIDAIVGFGGTPLFGFAHLIWFGLWIAVNLELVKGVPAFDPYPFHLLTFVVSLEAIFLSVAVLNSENRAMRLAERRANLDLQVNLLAEQESTATLHLVQRIAEHLGVGSAADRRAADLAVETDVQDVLDRLERHLPESPT